MASRSCGLKRAPSKPGPRPRRRDPLQRREIGGARAVRLHQRRDVGEILGPGRVAGLGVGILGGGVGRGCRVQRQAVLDRVALGEVFGAGHQDPGQRPDHGRVGADHRPLDPLGGGVGAQDGEVAAGGASGARAENREIVGPHIHERERDVALARARQGDPRGPRAQVDPGVGIERVVVGRGDGAGAMVQQLSRMEHPVHRTQRHAAAAEALHDREGDGEDVGVLGGVAQGGQAGGVGHRRSLRSGGADGRASAHDLGAEHQDRQNEARVVDPRPLHQRHDGRERVERPEGRREQPRAVARQGR